MSHRQRAIELLSTALAEVRALSPEADSRELEAILNDVGGLYFEIQEECDGRDRAVRALIEAVAGGRSPEADA